MNDRTGWSAALGIEVENTRMYGKKTLFVYDYPINENLDFKHIYFNEEFLLRYGFNEIYRWYHKPGIEVTISVYPDMLEQLPVDLLARCHIVLTFRTSTIKRLKEIDTVRVIIGEFNTITWNINQGLKAVPADYSGDTCGGIK